MGDGEVNSIRGDLVLRFATIAAIASAILAQAVVACGSARAADPLHLDVKIPLGTVGGRIDHMAIDLKRHRLFVAELGNNTVGVVDLEHKGS